MFFSPALCLSLPDIHRLTHTNTYAHAHINRSQITRHKKYKKVYVFNTQQQQQHQHEPKSFMLIFFLSSVVENFIMFFWFGWGGWILKWNYLYFWRLFHSLLTGQTDINQHITKHKVKKQQQTQRLKLNLAVDWLSRCFVDPLFSTHTWILEHIIYINWRL